MPGRGKRIRLFRKVPLPRLCLWRGNTVIHGAIPSAGICGKSLKLAIGSSWLPT